MSPEAATAPQADERARRIASWLADYRPSPGTADELLDPAGRPCGHWVTLLDALAGFGEAQVERRFANASRRIDEMGVTYRVHGEARERAAPLCRLPLLLPQDEWSKIEAGIAQRAELLDQLLLDIYGENRLVAEGALPAAAVAGSPEYVRPMCGVAPAGGRWLRFYAADIARGADGQWRVLGDRAQAPSGAGYALENRLIMARTFPSLFGDMNVRRLAPFFRDFRAGLASAAQRVDPRICLLTPGPFSETYAEQVSLARYLGLLLVEGEDLLANDGKLYVRTIAGLKRADVLWRRVDADWCDPLEMNASSRLGAPGLFEAIRQGAVALANMPGAGIIEARALMAFLPTLAPRLLGEKLKLDNVETIWCGQGEARTRALAKLDTMRIKSAFGAGILGRAEKPRLRNVRLRSRETPCGDERARHGSRRAGTACAFDDAGLGGRRIDSTPLRVAHLRRRDGKWLARDAWRLLPHLRPTGRERSLSGRGRAVGGRMGFERHADRDCYIAAGRRRRAHRESARQPSKPRGG